MTGRLVERFGDRLPPTGVLMTIRIVKRGASREKPFCPLLIDYPYEQPEPKQEADTRK